MQRFAVVVLKFRIPILIVTLILTLFFGWQMRHLRVNSDLITYLKPDDPAVQLFNRIGEEYAGTAMAMIGLEAEDVFTYDVLQTVNRLTEALRQLPGVATVTSLTDVLDIRSVDGDLEVGRLIDRHAIPSDPEELRRIRDYALSKDMYNGRLISSDGRITLIIARLQQKADKQALAEKIQQVAREQAPGYRLYFSGLPMQMVEINDIIIRDMTRLVPVVVLVLIGMLYFSFRMLRGVALPLLTVMISTVWALGLMSLLGYELTIISNIMPVLLIAIGSAYGIHMLARYNEDMRRHNINRHDTVGRWQSIRESLAEVGVPIILAGVTTLIGFFSFAGAYLTSVTQFGVFTGIGVAFALLISITVVPAVLAMLPPPPTRRTASGREANMLVHFLDWLADFVLRREGWILAGSVVVIGLAVVGLPRLHREVNLLEYFPRHTDIRRAEDMMREHFGGSNPIQLVVQGDMKHPFVLKEARELEKFLETLPDVSKPQSVADLICEMNRVMNGRYTVPDTREGVANLWFFIEGESVLQQMVNPDASEGIIQANLATMEMQQVRRVVRAIDRYFRTRADSVRIVVRRDELPLALQRQVLADGIYWLIALDVARHGATVPDSAALLKAILQVIEPQDERLSKTLISELREKWLDFFLMESPVEIDDDAEVERLVGRLVRSLQARQIKNEAALSRALRRWLPRDQRDDVGAVEETVQIAWRMVQELVQKQRVQRAAERLLALLPDSLQQNPDFRDDVRDDLWMMNETYIAVSPDDARRAGVDGERVRLQFRQSGMPLIYTRLDDSLMRSQLQSLAIALLLVTLILMVQFRSLLAGLIAVSPIVLTVLMNFALMAYLNVPLDNATMMIASIAIGIGIDYAIHFTSRFKMEFGRQGDGRQALATTLETTGRAILINALSVASGFIILVFAQLIPIRQFGWLTASTMFFSAVGAMTFLPALILYSGDRHFRNHGNS
ncbi:MAG: MMPL family transporter [candidate division KSB1 bacterium]|nr:MMPL family transporter [candidate division KSB1 bacterium]